MPDRKGQPATLDGPSSGWRRRVVNLLIPMVIAIHVAIPASYYLGDTHYDERFAWRMFSSIRAETCRLSVTESVSVGPQGERSRKLTLSTVIHKAWQNGLQRFRPAIMERFFEFRCAEPGIRSIRLQRRCKSGAGAMRETEQVEHRCEMPKETS